MPRISSSAPWFCTPEFTSLFLYSSRLAVALLMRLAVEQPAVRFALLVLFVTFEFCFYVLVNTVSEEVGALFPLWTVLAANLLATAAMAAYFLAGAIRSLAEYSGRSHSGLDVAAGPAAPLRGRRKPF